MQRASIYLFFTNCFCYQLLTLGKPYLKLALELNFCCCCCCCCYSGEVCCCNRLKFDFLFHDLSLYHHHHHGAMMTNFYYSYHAVDCYILLRMLHQTFPYSTDALPHHVTLDLRSSPLAYLMHHN